MKECVFDRLFVILALTASRFHVVVAICVLLSFTKLQLDRLKSVKWLWLDQAAEITAKQLEGGEHEVDVMDVGNTNSYNAGALYHTGTSSW